MGVQDPSHLPLLQRLTSHAARRNQRMIRHNSHVVHFEEDESQKKNITRRVRNYMRADSVRERYDEVDKEAQPYAYQEMLLQLVDAEDYESLRSELDSGKYVDVVDEGTKMTALHIAAKRKNVAILKLLLDKNANINAQENTGHTPLHFATRKDNVACCRLLLDSPKLKVNLCNKENNTALHDAAKEGMKDICDMILSHADIDINAKNKQGLTALHLAARENHPQVLQLLMDKGADWKSQDKHLYLPIHYAATKGFPECCHVLVNSDVTRKEKQLTKTLKDGKTAMILAAKNGYHKCVAELMFNNINAKDKTGNTALHYATSGGFENTIRELLELGSNSNILNKNGCPAVLEAASKKKINCLNALCEKGAKLDMFDKDGKGVLHYAAEKNAEECMKFLLEIEEVKLILDRKEKTKDCTAFHLAIKKEAVDCALLLLEKGASATEQCGGGMTPLHLAADKGNTSICEKLLARPEVHKSCQENENKATPLHLAAMHGSVDVCQMLLRKGARLTAVDVHGRTALHVACNKGHANVVKLLSKRGASIKEKDETGSTALHLAASSKAAGALECCKVLASSCKARNWDVDRDKFLPLDKAFENENEQIFKYLLNKLTFKDGQNDRESCLHKYMHQALEEKRMVIVEAIIFSEWWKAGFAGNEHHQCFNFKTLLKDYPDWALKVQEKCVLSSSAKKTSYDFRLYNDNCFFKSECSDEYSNFRNQIGVEWKKDHPLEQMVLYNRHQNLHHPLTKAWLLQKWQSHIYIIFLGLLLLEIGFVAALMGYMALIDNWNHITVRCNFTYEQFMNASEEMTTLEFQKCTGNVNLKYGMWATLLAATVATLLIELNYVYRLRCEYFRIAGNIIRVPRLLFSIIILLPLPGTSSTYMVLNIEQWQCGVAALLLAWLHLINTINELPMLSVFMPITRSFLRSFFKVLFYIVMLVFVFAFIFHLLLADQDAFKSINQAMVKTIVWMLGDLAYDDTFLSEKDHLFYPAMVNFLFVVFVTIIGGFIVNLVITQPSSSLDDFREKASFHLAASRVALFLRIEVCFPWYRKNTVDDFDGYYTHQNSLIKKLLLLDTNAEAPETPNTMEIQLEEQSKQISTLLTLQYEQKEEIQELRHQLRLLVNKTLELAER